MEGLEMKYTKILLAAALIVAACAKENIPTYKEVSGERYIYFAKAEQDSSDVSFYSYPGQKVIEYPIVVKSTGYSTSEGTFSVNVLKEYTTAGDGGYSLEENSHSVRKARWIRST